MLARTNTPDARWWVVQAVDKKRARLNCISHILSMIPYKKVPKEKVEMPKRSNKGAYDDQAMILSRRFVAENY